MQNDSSYSIRNSKLIISNLSLLVKNKCLFSVHFGEHDESFITTIIDFNQKDNSIIFDYGPKENLNQRLLSATKVTFKTDFSGIKVSFDGSTLERTVYDGAPAFIMPVPESLFWMQRREFYRVKSPISNSSHCQLMLKDRDPISLELYDISLTGFSMLNVSKEISDLLPPGARFSQSKLILSELGEGIVSFEVCAKNIINPDKLKKLQKIGCKFTRVTPAFEAVIQRYMQQIEIENRQREKN